MKNTKQIKEITLCMDDWFPNCDGTRTHPLKVSEILAIPEVHQAILNERKRLLEKVENVLENTWGDKYVDVAMDEIKV